MSNPIPTNICNNATYLANSRWVKNPHTKLDLNYVEGKDNCEVVEQTATHIKLKVKANTNFTIYGGRQLVCFRYPEGEGTDVGTWSNEVWSKKHRLIQPSSQPVYHYTKNGYTWSIKNVYRNNLIDIRMISSNYAIKFTAGDKDTYVDIYLLYDECIYDVASCVQWFKELEPTTTTLTINLVQANYQNIKNALTPEQIKIATDKGYTVA